MSRSRSERRKQKMMREKRNAARKARLEAMRLREEIPAKPVPQSVFCRVKRQRSSVWQGTYDALLKTRQIDETYQATETVELADGTTVRKLVDQKGSRRERPLQKRVDGNKHKRGSESHIEPTDRAYSAASCRIPRKRSVSESRALMLGRNKKTDAKTGAVYYTASRYQTVTVCDIESGLGEAKRVERFPQPKLDDEIVTQSLKSRIAAIRKSAAPHGVADTRIGNTNQQGPLPIVSGNGALPESVYLAQPTPIEKRRELLNG